MLQVMAMTDNDAFTDNLAGESARLLRVIADRIERGEFTGLFESVHDENGNAVGAFRLKPCACPDPCEHIR